MYQVIQFVNVDDKRNETTIKTENKIETHPQCEPNDGKHSVRFSFPHSRLALDRERLNAQEKGNFLLLEKSKPMLPINNVLDKTDIICTAPGQIALASHDAFVSGFNSRRKEISERILSCCIDQVA